MDADSRSEPRQADNRCVANGIQGSLNEACRGDQFVVPRVIVPKGTTVTMHGTAVVDGVTLPAGKTLTIHGNLTDRLRRQMCSPSTSRFWDEFDSRIQTDTLPSGHYPRSIRERQGHPG